MSGKCYFCHGTVSGFESDHILLTDHADHEVYMHEQCAAGHNAVEKAVDQGDRIEVTCPVCGSVETQ